MTYNRNLNNHPQWLDKLNHRCQFSGAIVGKHHKGQYRRYNFHHSYSGAYGSERPGVNLLLLTPWAHGLVHLLGLVPPWTKNKVRFQNNMARQLGIEWLLGFPNPLQRLFNVWCQLPVPAFLRALVVGLATALITFTVVLWVGSMLIKYLQG